MASIPCRTARRVTGDNRPGEELVAEQALLKASHPQSEGQQSEQSNGYPGFAPREPSPVSPSTATLSDLPPGLDSSEPNT